MRTLMEARRLAAAVLARAVLARAVLARAVLARAVLARAVLARAVLAGAAAVLAAGCAAPAPAAGPASAGALTSPAGSPAPTPTGSPAPSPTGSPAPTPTGSPVPASAVPMLTAIAASVARSDGDPTPSQVTAVLTTHAKALTSATPGDLVPGSGGVRVFLLTMQGRFTATDATRPPGSKAPTGRYLSLVVDAANFQVTDFGLSPKPPPVSPASLGPVTYLTVGPA
jgi:hypothetical protein